MKDKENDEGKWELSTILEHIYTHGESASSRASANSALVHQQRLNREGITKIEEVLHPDNKVRLYVHDALGLPAALDTQELIGALIGYAVAQGVPRTNSRKTIRMIITGPGKCGADVAGLLGPTFAQLGIELNDWEEV